MDGPGLVGADLADELREGLAIAVEHLDVDLGIVSRIEGDTYVVEHVHDRNGALQPGQTFSLGQTYCAITLHADDLVTIDEMGSSAHRGHPCYAAFGLESYIGLPIRVAGRRYGTVNFSSARRRTEDYGVGEQGLVRLLARWVESRLGHAHVAQARRVAETKLGSLLSAAPDGILLHRDGHIVEANETLAQMVGLPSASALVGRPLFDFIPVAHHREQSLERLATLARGRVPDGPQQLQLTHAEGHRVWVEARGVPLELDDGMIALTIVRDMSARDELQRALQTQRLADIGAVASGVAHDLKSPITALSLGLTVAREIVGDLAPTIAQADLEQALDEAREACRMIRNVASALLDYARRGGTRELHDVRALLGTALRITRHELDRRAQVVERYGATPPIVADGPRLTQVFVNLIVNAYQAIGDGDPRCDAVQIETELRAEDRVAIVVSDTGPGIPAEQLDRIFERFYTTKPRGEGTGLGLALCSEIVEAHGGSLEVANRPSGGASFTVVLPITPPPAPSQDGLDPA